MTGPNSSTLHESDPDELRTGVGTMLQAARPASGTTGAT